MTEGDSHGEDRVHVPGEHQAPAGPQAQGRPHHDVVTGPELVLDKLTAMFAGYDTSDAAIGETELGRVLSWPSGPTVWTHAFPDGNPVLSGVELPAGTFVIVRDATSMWLHQPAA